MNCYTVTLQGVIVAVSDTFEDAERIARNVGTDSLIECPDGTKLEFCMGWYRKVGERSPLFELAKTLAEVDSPEDEIEMARRLVG